MIQIVDLHVVEFRGIRDLFLKFDGESFVVWGPNGSGKSGVVDALDFALTGDVSRLRGAGSGGVTLSRHGPHVSRRDDPDSAFVEVTVLEPETGAAATLKRTVKAPGTFSLDPEVAVVRSAIERVENHPELILSRREIIKYIVAESGKRASEIQALLKLDRLGVLRSAFRSMKSKTASELKAARAAERSADQALERHLDLPSLLTGEISRVVNAQRVLLNLEPLGDLTADTNLSAGLERSDSPNTFNRGSAMRDVDAVAALVSEPASLAAASESLKALLEPLEADPTLLDALEKRALVDAGLKLLDDDHCPLCDTRWEDMTVLRRHLEQKKSRSDDAANLRTAVMGAASRVAAELEAVARLARSGRNVAAELGLDDIVAVLDSWIALVDDRVGSMASLELVRELGRTVAQNPTCEPENLATHLGQLRRAIEALPDQSATSAARSFLTIAQERWVALRAARAQSAKAEASDSAADVVYQTYCEAQDEGLVQLYAKVQDRLAEFYRMINSDDEAQFKALLEPKAQKLDLLVDFHGIGMFPPVAYHSEGHQDGMGVCLYLALMERLLGDDFRLAVLDDVVMSVDVNHRRQFCSLLIEFFPDVQFIITTHDEVWANQMQKSGLVTKSQQAHFLGWSVDSGPVVMEGADFWDRVAEDLDRNDVNAAAARLRRNLEAALADIAEQLGAMVPYRPVGGWDLGEYMNAVKGRYSRLLKAAAKAANSWNNEESQERVAIAQREWNAASLVQSSEQWAVNPAVHYNAWANFAKADFEPVVEASRTFLEIFRCSTCGAQVHLSRSSGRDEALRCACGEINFGLLGR